VKWAFAIASLFLACGVALFGIYTFGWRENDDVGSGASLAHAYAGAIERDFPAWHVTRFRHVGERVWKVSAKRRGETRCLLLDVDRFKRNGKDDYAVTASLRT
jgi:hypothetical protein